MVPLFYDLDLFTVIRSLRDTYTGEFHNTFNTIKALHETKCGSVLIKEVSRTLLIEFPNKMNITSTYDNFLNFFR